MKIFNILFFGLLIISNSSIGDEYPIITEKMLNSGYNKLELQYDPQLPLITPYPKHGAALFYQAVIFENGYGVEKDINKAIKYYDKACRIKGNKVIIACENLFSIYLHGNKGVPQDLNKAKEYAKWIAENGSQKYQEYIKRWDYILFSLELSLKLKECKKSGINASICIRKSNNALLEYANKMYPIE